MIKEDQGIARGIRDKLRQEGIRWESLSLEQRQRIQSRAQELWREMAAEDATVIGDIPLGMSAWVSVLVGADARLAGIKAVDDCLKDKI